MPSAIDATVGGSSSNSYVTLAEANTYMGDRLHTTAWTAATNDTKNSALLWAARLLDRTVRWSGSKASESQSMEWPRSGMIYHDGSEVPDDEIPVAIKEAQIETAFSLLSGDRLAENSVSAQGINKIKAGPVEIGFSSSIEMTSAISDNVMSLIPQEWYLNEDNHIPYPIVVT